VQHIPRAVDPRLLFHDINRLTLKTPELRTIPLYRGVAPVASGGFDVWLHWTKRNSPCRQPAEMGFCRQRQSLLFFIGAPFRHLKHLGDRGRLDQAKARLARLRRSTADTLKFARSLADLRQGLIDGKELDGMIAPILKSRIEEEAKALEKKTLR